METKKYEMGFADITWTFSIEVAGSHHAEDLRKLIQVELKVHIIH